jgi:hypothetical protein
MDENDTGFTYLKNKFPCPTEKKLTTNSNSAQKNAFGFTYFSLCDKNTNYFVIQCYKTS